MRLRHFQRIATNFAWPNTKFISLYLIKNLKLLKYNAKYKQR